jgi:hypothetical protein
MSRNFKKDVPYEIVLQFYKILGLTSLDDRRDFTKDYIRGKALEDMKALLPSLNDYLCPRLLEREHTPKTFISLLKILAFAQGYDVIVSQKGKNRIKFYRLCKIDIQ